MRPPFNYYGAKGNFAKRIAQLLPPHLTYVEPYAGSLAVLFAKDPSREEIVNDIDRGLCTFFKVLRDRPQELEDLLRLTPYSRDDYYEVREIDERDPAIGELALARQFWIRVNMGFGHNGNRTTGFSVVPGFPLRLQQKLGRFADYSARLSYVVIENMDAVELIEKYGTPDAVMYVDPPYIMSTRHPGTPKNAYRTDMGDPEDHQKLADALNKTPATVFLSGYPSPEYDEDLFPTWNVMDMPAPNSVRGERVERLWSNRPFEDMQNFLPIPS